MKITSVEKFENVTCIVGFIILFRGSLASANGHPPTGSIRVRMDWRA